MLDMDLQVNEFNVMKRFITVTFLRQFS